MTCKRRFLLAVISVMYINYFLVLFIKLRKEADDIGPAAELDHWKQRMAKFNR